MNTAPAALPAPSVFRKIREDRGLSQEQVSLALGVPRTHITTLENDELRAKLVRFYGIKPARPEMPEHVRVAVEQSFSLLPSVLAASALHDCAKAEESTARITAHVSTVAFNVVVGGFFLMFAVGAGFALTGGAL